MWDWFKDQARKAFKWLAQRSSGRTLASLVALVATVYICVVVGGIMGQACIITLCVYVGTLITLNRMRKPPPESSSIVWKKLSAPLRGIANFFFKHSLVTTILLGAIAGSMVGFTTVTGIAVGALCAFAGDFIVGAFISIVDFANEINDEIQEELEYNGEPKLVTEAA